MDIIEYAKMLTEAGFVVWHTPSTPRGFLSYTDPETGMCGTFQHTLAGEWAHLMPLKPTVYYGSHMFIDKPLDPWTVEAARQCAQATNFNEAVGTQPNAGSLFLPSSSVLVTL